MSQINAVEAPIINSPYDEPRHYWHIEDGEASRRSGQDAGAASYFFRVPERAARGRQRQGAGRAVRGGRPRGRSTCSTWPTCSGSGSQDWRERDYEGATKVTRELLAPVALRPTGRSHCSTPSSRRPRR